MKILYKTIFGSKLYGTATISSDSDYKGIYAIKLSDIVLGKTHVYSSISTSNKKDKSHKSGAETIETEFYSLQKFIQHAIDGQTAAIDMLYSPPQYWLEVSDTWRKIYNHRSEFLSKKLYSFVGYCRNQAAKYGIKGSRLNCVKKFIDFFNSVDEESLIGEHKDKFNLLLDEHSLIHLSNLNHECYLDICGKKFLFTTKVKHVIPALMRFWEAYGERARMASNDEGVDFKAISHAFRVAYEVKELVETRNLVFPLAHRQFLLDVKTHKYRYLDISPQLEDLISEVSECVEKSDLPEYPLINCDEIILNYYENEKLK